MNRHEVKRAEHAFNYEREQKENKVRINTWAISILYEVGECYPLNPKDKKEKIFSGAIPRTSERIVKYYLEQVSPNRRKTDYKIDSKHYQKNYHAIEKDPIAIVCVRFYNCAKDSREANPNHPTIGISLRSKKDPYNEQTGLRIARARCHKIYLDKIGNCGIPILAPEHPQYRHLYIIIQNIKDFINKGHIPRIVKLSIGAKPHRKVTFLYYPVELPITQLDKKVFSGTGKETPSNV